MINLLPKDRIKQLRAAQQNTLLLRYIIATTITLLLVLAIHVAAFALLKNAERANAVIAQENQAQIDEYRHIREQSEEYVANLKTAKAIFDASIAYSNVAVNIAQNLPEGVILQSIDLDRSTIGQPTTLVAKTRSYDAGIALKEKLQDSTIAKDVSIASTTDDRDENAESADATHPFTITLNLTYTENILQPNGGTE
ncbi:MAG: PilN domain-containing protein [Candidatus Saccharimonadales bacterium]